MGATLVQEIKKLHAYVVTVHANEIESFISNYYFSRNTSVILKLTKSHGTTDIQGENLKVRPQCNYAK